MNMQITTKIETPPPDALCSLASSSVLGKTSKRLRMSPMPP